MDLLLVEPDGSKRSLPVGEGTSLMAAMRDAGVPISAQCGGCCSCATCHVYVDEVWIPRLPQLGEDEDALLDLAPERRAGSRLSCQIHMTGSLAGIELRLGAGSEI